MFKTGDILDQRYLLKQPLGTSQNGRQTWLAIDLGSHEFGLLVKCFKTTLFSAIALVKRD